MAVYRHYGSQILELKTSASYERVRKHMISVTNQKDRKALLLQPGRRLVNVTGEVPNLVLIVLSVSKKTKG